MEGKEIKIEFVIDKTHESRLYTIEEILSMYEEDVIENMESCDCQFNESVNHCEGDCLKFEGSEITGYNIIDPELEKSKQLNADLEQRLKEAVALLVKASKHYKSHELTTFITNNEKK